MQGRCGEQTSGQILAAPAPQHLLAAMALVWPKPVLRSILPVWARAPSNSSVGGAAGTVAAAAERAAVECPGIPAQLVANCDTQ